MDAGSLGKGLNCQKSSTTASWCPRTRRRVPLPVTNQGACPAYKSFQVQTLRVALDPCVAGPGPSRREPGGGSRICKVCARQYFHVYSARDGNGSNIGPSSPGSFGRPAGWSRVLASWALLGSSPGPLSRGSSFNFSGRGNNGGGQRPGVAFGDGAGQNPNRATATQTATSAPDFREELLTLDVGGEAH